MQNIKIEEKKLNGRSREQLIKMSFVFILSFFCISLVQSLSWYDSTSDINFSATNVNNSIYLQGYTPFDLPNITNTYNITYHTWSFNQSAIKYNFNQSNIQYNFNQSAIAFNYNQTIPALIISNSSISNIINSSIVSNPNFPFKTTSTTIYNDTANVRIGLGVTTPTSFLDIRGNASINNTLFVSQNGRVGIGLIPTTNNLEVLGAIKVYNNTGTSSVNLSIWDGFFTDYFRVFDLNLDADGTNKVTYFRISNKSSWVTQLSTTGSGGNTFRNVIWAGTDGSSLRYNKFGSGTPGSGQVTNGNDLYITETLEVDGTAYLAGGTAWTQGDIAENIETKASRQNKFCKGDVSCYTNNTKDDLDYGDLVCIDTTEGHTITKCKEANSRLAVGVITNTSVLQVGPYSGYPVSLAGVVWTHVTNENGNVVPGDLLVSSSKPGYAMKNDNPKDGTIIGKAFDFCDKPKCDIRIFVALS